MPTRSLPAIIIAILVLATACSGDDRSGDRDEITTATAIARSATPDPTSAPQPSAAAGSDDAAASNPDPQPDAGESGIDAPGAVDLLLSSDLTADQRECAFSRLQDDPELVERSLAATDAGDQVAVEDQADLVVIAFDCAPETFAEAFTAAVSIDSVELPPTVTQCFVETMGPDNPDQRSVIVGLAALGVGQAVPSAARPPLVDALVACFPGSFFGEAVTAQALADPALAGALDVACIDAGFDAATLRPLWELLVENPGLDVASLDPAATAPLFDAVFACLSFGRVIAGQAAAAGVDISDETVDCIDRRLEGVDLAAELNTTSETSATRIAVTECLTPEERAAMGG